jgi:hypothetical protein
MLAERLHAETLGRMVSRREQVDPELARSVVARLLRLPGDKDVVARVRGLDQVVAGAAARDRDPLDGVGTAAQEERLPAGDLTDGGGEVVDRRGLA